MLTITMTNNSIKAERNGITLFIAAKNAVSYSYGSTMVFLNAPDIVRISEAFSRDITMNGTPVPRITSRLNLKTFLKNRAAGLQIIHN